MLPLRYKATFPRCPSLSCLSWPRCERTTTHHLPQLPVMSGETVSLSIPLPFVLQQWTRRWWLPNTTSVKTFPRSIFSPPALGPSHLSLRLLLCSMWLSPNPWSSGCSGGCSSWSRVCWGPTPKKKNSEKIRFWRKKNHKKMVFLRDMWSGTALGLAWFSRPFAPETRQKTPKF